MRNVLEFAEDFVVNLMWITKRYTLCYSERNALIGFEHAALRALDPTTNMVSVKTPIPTNKSIHGDIDIWYSYCHSQRFTSQ